MKNSIQITLPLLILLAFLSSCHKDGSSKPPTTTVPPNDSTTIGTMKINLALPSYVTNSELIISETTGKVLLDTLAPSGATIVATLQTNATLVDLTYVGFQQIDSNRYSVSTYKAVNPSTWTSLTGSGIYKTLSTTGNYANASVLFTNVHYNQVVQFSAGALGSTGYAFDPGAATVSATYYQYPNSYVYLLLPNYQLYKLQAVDAQKDTIDCTTMDTANAVIFNKPSYYTLSTSSLYGWVDTTNVNSSIDLYFYYPSPQTPVIPDLVYPKKGIQAFMLFASWSGPGPEESMTAYSYGDSIPTSFNLPPPGSYNISSTKNTAFAMQINTTKPSYCYTYWGNGSVTTKNVIFWNLYASPDSTSFNPLSILMAQKSKLLQGMDLTTLSLNGFSCENVPGYDYAGYLELLFKPNTSQPNHVSNTILYGKQFQ